MNKLTKEATKIENVQKTRKTQKRKKSKFYQTLLIKAIAFEYILAFIILFVAFLYVTNKSYQEQILLKNQIIEIQEQFIKIYKEPKAEIKVEEKITSADREMIARLLYLEGRGESIECQRAIVSVVINRLNSGYWGDTVKEVIYAKNQFEPANKIPNTTPNKMQYDAVDYVLDNGTTIPSWVLYFRASYHFDWQGYTKYAQMSNTFFGGHENDKR